MAPMDAQDSLMSDESDDEPQIWRSGDGQSERVHRTPYSLVGPMHHKQPGRHEVVYRPPVYQIDAVEWTGKGSVNGAEPLARNLPAVHIGFTREQKKTLKEQIMASKTLKKSIEQSTFMPSDWEKVKPMPLPAAISAEKDMSLLFERWMQAFGLHGATAADKAMMAAWQQPTQLQDAVKKQNTAVVQRKQKALEKSKKEEASKAAEAERAAKQAQLEREAQQRRQIIEAHPAVQRLWPHALYHLDYELRSNPQAVDFQLNSSLPKMLANERNRLLEKSRNEWASRIMSQLQDNDGSRTSGDMRTARTRLLVQQRKLKLLGMQRQLRQKVERRQQVINQMPERIYKKFQNEVKKYLSAAEREAQDKYCALWGNRLAGVRHVRGEIYTKLANWKDVRLVMNRAVVKQHERLLRQNKPETAMDNREARMQALKANDFAAYQAMLKATQGDAAALDDRYAAITSFLAETENYLNTLTETIMEKKLHETKEKAFSAALADARAAGVPEEAAEQQAIQAANEAAEKSEFARMNENLAGDAQARYVALAHAVEEDVKQPRMLRGPGGARLREYQHVGLKWMVSLYNNNLNGILADEMGLGKTVQVMALIAHLMEEKGNFGPHLIVVPNAVLVNWRAEMTTWLPDCKVVYYHGEKSLRNQMWKEQVESITFNVLVTTYEFIMYDAKQLSKMQWKYLIIDEAQRMKDRDSKLSKAFDKFSFEKRLLLTGTPLQNELRELWSLLNLLLPQLFNDQQQFAKWFGDALTKNSKGDSEEDLIDNERRVVVVNRLHQILEPFMLRRQVQDVEGKLPEKVTITIKCPMTGYQGAIYDWVRATSLLRINPSSADAIRRGTNIISVRNRVMEQRKICNHPLITYPPDGYEASMLKHWYDADERLVAQCGKMLFVDRLLVKFYKTGHRVLLFSTMTKVLDIMERYLLWRTLGEKMQFRRIDGTTALEDREKAVHDFNRKGSDVYVFLLSIRAAGRGLNLQTADTVIMYDPDANPKNEEQAVARSHRIGQTKPVRVIHLEAVADATPDATIAEDGDYDGDAEGDAARAAAANAAAVANRRGIGAVAAAATDVRRNTTKYADSVESVYRHVIQKQKNDMAAEIIDAGRFDRKTTDAERKSTLEQIVADAERNKIAKNEVPTWDWIHRKLARSPAELEEFEKIEEEMEWIEPWTLEKTPEWIRFTAEDVKAAVPERKRRRGELEIPSMTGWGAVKDTYDESGRRVRKARVKAADKIAAHAEWVTHNPYRMPQPGELPDAPDKDDSAATADEEPNGTNGAQPSNTNEGGSACPSASVAGAPGRSTGTAEDDDEEAQPFSDADDMEEQDDGDNFD